MMNIKTHNGTITMYNPKTGNHRTLKIKTNKDTSDFAPHERIVYLLTGSNNERDYTSLGILKDNGEIVLWKKHRGSVTIAKYIDMILNPDKYSDRIKYMFEDRCRICNRKLTTPESIESGIGPICEKFENIRK